MKNAKINAKVNCGSKNEFEIDSKILVEACFSFSNSPRHSVKTKPIKMAKIPDYF